MFCICDEEDNIARVDKEAMSILETWTDKRKEERQGLQDTLAILKQSREQENRERSGEVLASAFLGFILALVIASLYMIA